MNIQHTIEQLNLTTDPTAFVLASDQAVRSNPFLFSSIADEIGLDTSVVEIHHEDKFVQNVVVELLKNADTTLEQASAAAHTKTINDFSTNPFRRLIDKSPVKLSKPENSKVHKINDVDQAEVVDSEKPVVNVDDKKAKARALYDANHESMTTAQLINLIADELKITKANSRYYVTRVLNK